MKPVSIEEDNYHSAEGEKDKTWHSASQSKKELTTFNSTLPKAKERKTKAKTRRYAELALRTKKK